LEKAPQPSEIANDGVDGPTASSAKPIFSAMRRDIAKRSKSWVLIPPYSAARALAQGHGANFSLVLRP
jgi:hypothetical protein